MNTASTPAQPPAPKSTPKLTPKLTLEITLADYFMGRDKLYPAELNDQRRVNAADTVRIVNELLKACGIPTYVASGFRPPQVNSKTPRAAKLSNHMICKACDLHDPEGLIGRWCLTHQDVLAKLGLWLEDPAHTKGWCHVQILAPRSGRRVFIP